MATKTPQKDQISEEDQDTEEKGTVVQLFPITGGKEPPKGNWLSELQVGHVFLARSSSENQDVSLLEYRVHEKFGNATWLKMFPTPNTCVSAWVDNRRFSKTMERVELLN